MKRLLLILVLALPLWAAAQEMKIISFNVRYNSAWEDDGENRWENRREAAAQMIMDERPAAIGLQEALIDQLHFLDSRLDGYIRVGVGRDNGEEEGEFMAIYYDKEQLELVKYETQWLSETPEKPSKGWDAACRRTVTVALFRDLKSDMFFCYLNTHLDHVGKMARAEGTKQIASIVRNLYDKAIPVIVGGDMNSTIKDPIFRNFYDEGLQVARDMTEESSNAITYNAFGKGKGSVIDHFFVRNMKVMRFLTLDGNYGVPYISDHYPIEVVVELQN